MTWLFIKQPVGEVDVSLVLVLVGQTLDRRRDEGGDAVWDDGRLIPHQHHEDHEQQEHKAKQHP